MQFQQGTMVLLITCWLRDLIFCCSRYHPLSLQLRHLVNGTPPSSSYTFAKNHHTIKRCREDGLPNTMFPCVSSASCYSKTRFILDKRELSLQLIPSAKALESPPQNCSPKASNVGMVKVGRNPEWLDDFI